MPREGDQQARETAEAVARHSYGKLVAYLAAQTGDVARAEDALSEAFASALIDWPLHGAPHNPEGWLIAVAKRKIIDMVRRRKSSEKAAGHLRLLAEEMEAAAEAGAEIPDDRLSLMFACAHPAIDPGIRAPLILQTLLGFDAATIASAFLVSPAAMGQRLSRAKHKIREAGIPFRIPDSSDLAERLDAVLESIYAAFAEGWSDSTGTESGRRNLAGEAIWLGRLVAALLPDAAEALGLLALMLHSEARRGARRNADGDYVPLAEQDPAAWDTGSIEEAEALLLRASDIGGLGRYQLEAAIQSAHAIRRLTGRSDWEAIEKIYDALVAISASPVAAINRAIAIAENRGAAAGLEALADLEGDERLNGYQPYWAARAALLSRAGEFNAAEAAYERAIGLERDPAVRGFLQRRQAALRGLGAASSQVDRKPL
jgi:RNA polymerase sigma-70 factor (ECF subfamily)